MAMNTPVCDFGWAAPDFALATPQGHQHSRDSLMGENGLLVAFICNHCPYVIAVIDRLADDIRQMQNAGIGAVCIMSNDYAAHPADSPENMTRFAAAHDLPAPYLLDADQTVARAYDAVCTPDFFGFDRDGRLQYRGRIDDAGMKDPATRVPELLNAMQMVAKTGHGPKEQVPSMGCSIKWR